MAILIRKAHDLILDGGAVARARAVDGSGVHWGAVDVFADDAVGVLVGIGQVAFGAVLKRAVGQEGEGRDGFVAGLRLHFIKINGGFLDAGRCAGLEAAQLDVQRAQRVCQMRRGKQPLRPAHPTALADDDAAIHIHAGADDDRAAGDGCAGGRLDAADCAVFGQKPATFALTNGQARFGEERLLHPLLIGAFIRLRAEGMDGRPLAGVEHAGLDERIVDGAAHFAAERVDLADEMPLARAADGGIAGHEGDGIQIEREQQGIKPHARAGQRRLAARVPRADDGNIKTIHKSRNLREES